MTRSKEEASSIAWGWVMETLADLKQVETPLIDDLLSKVPCGSDSLSSAARERLALRRLEGLLASTSIANSRERSPVSDNIDIDISESAQDVYNRLVSIQMEASSSRASISDSLKLGVHFALQKRACLPKCVIQKLDDVLTDGGHPCMSVLKGTSEEVVQKLDQIRNCIIAQTPELNSTRSVPGNPNKRLQEDISGRPSSSAPKRVRFADERLTTDYTDNVVNDTAHTTEVGEVHETNEITTSPVSENQTRDLRDGHAKDGVASHRRTRSVVTKEQDALCSKNSQPDLEAPPGNVKNSGHKTQVQELHDDVICVDNNIGKAPQAHQEALQDGHWGDNSQTELEAERGNAEYSRKRTQVQNLLEDVTRLGHDDGDEERVSKRLKVGADLTNVSSRGIAEHVSNISLDSSKNMMGARLPMNQGSVGADWAEEKTCVKCNRGDHLLICSGCTCFISVHESCLGTPACFDSAGNFYCPYCSYSRASIECLELAKRLTEANQNVDLAKSRLAQFMQNETI